MKHPVKKILSSMFVGCMLLSAFTMTAGAAELDTQTATVYNQLEDGTVTSFSFNYTVSNDTSDREVQDMVASMATVELQNQSGVMPLSSEPSDWTDWDKCIAFEDNMRINKNTGDDTSNTILNCSRLSRDYSALGIVLQNASGNASGLNIGVENGSYPDEVVYEMNAPIDYDADTVVYFCDGDYYGGGSMWLEKNDVLNMRFSAQGGSCRADVAVYTYR